MWWNGNLNKWIWFGRYNILIFWNGFLNDIKLWNDIWFWEINTIFEIITTGYNNDWLLKRPGSDMDILSVDTENHFNHCVRSGYSRMK